MFYPLDLLLGETLAIVAFDQLFELLDNLPRGVFQLLIHEGLRVRVNVRHLDSLQ